MNEKLEIFLVDFINEYGENWELEGLVVAMNKAGFPLGRDWELISILYDLLTKYANHILRKFLESNIDETTIGDVKSTPEDVEMTLIELYRYCKQKQDEVNATKR